MAVIDENEERNNNEDVSNQPLCPDDENGDVVRSVDLNLSKDLVGDGRGSSTRDVIGKGGDRDRDPEEGLELEHLQRKQREYGGTDDTQKGKKEDKSMEKKKEKDSCFHQVNGTFLAVKSAYFLVLGGRVSFLPFIPVYLAELGLNANRIGQIAGLEAFVGLVASPIWGLVADKFNKKKAVLITCVVGTILIYGSTIFLPFLRVDSVPIYDDQTNSSIINMLPEFAEPQIFAWKQAATTNATYRTVNVNVSVEDSSSDVDAKEFNIFAIFFIMMTVVLVGQTFSNPCLPLLDTATMSLIDEYRAKGETMQYGRQRLWGAISWGIIAPLSGYAVDTYSAAYPEAFNRYLPAYILFFLIMTSCAVTISFIPMRPREPAQRLFDDLGTLIRQPNVLLFMYIVTIMGIMIGFMNTYVFLFLAELKGGHVIMGLTLTIMCTSEIPFMMFASKLIEKFGHEGVLSFVLFCYGLRFVGYSLLYNPWWVLPIEVLHGVTYGLMWPGCTSFIHSVSPANMAATMQSIAYGSRVGLGKGLGTLIGGILYHRYGARNLFRGSAVLAMSTFVFYAACSLILKRRRALQYTQL